MKLNIIICKYDKYQQQKEKKFLKCFNKLIMEITKPSIKILIYLLFIFALFSLMDHKGMNSISEFSFIQKSLC